MEKRSQKYLREQVFPLLLHKNAKDRFNFEDCRFTLSRSKEATGRIVFRNMGIVNSYTLEASYGGSSIGNKVTSYFSNFYIKGTVSWERFWQKFTELGLTKGRGWFLNFFVAPMILSVLRILSKSDEANRRQKKYI